MIGAGPTGMFAAFYAGLREMETKIIETLPEVGGQVTVLYPEKIIYDVPGFSKILGKDLIKELLEQTLTFAPKMHMNETTTMIRHLSGNIIEVETDKTSHFSRTVIITAGIGALSPNKLNKPGVDKFEGKGVSYRVIDKAALRGKNVLIIGGGDSAVDWALNLDNWCRKVTLIHRRDGFRALESSLAQLRTSNVDVKTFYELKEVKGNAWVEEAVIHDNRNNQETRLNVDAVLIFVGHKADLGYLKNWGLDLEGRYVKVDSKMQTNLPGVFAAGDIVAEPGGLKLNLIVVGFSQAAIAVAAAKRLLDPLAPVFEHSSEKGIRL